jgi:hypothetical protein
MLRLQIAILSMKNRSPPELRKAGFDEGKIRRDSTGRFSAQRAGADSGNELAEKLDKFAVPMMEVEYSVENYNKLFPEGKVKTPLGTVRMGRDQFAKLGRKDGGARKSYLGAAWQTLTDPVLVIGEGNDRVYIKSFSGEKGITSFVSVEKDKDGERVVVTNYRRDIREIARKIKNWADIPLYQKATEGGGPAGGTEGEPLAISDDNHLNTVSHKPFKKSSPKLVLKIRKSEALRLRLGGLL